MQIVVPTCSQFFLSIFKYFFFVRMSTKSKHHTLAREDDTPLFTSPPHQGDLNVSGSVYLVIAHDAAQPINDKIYDKLVFLSWKRE